MPPRFKFTANEIVEAALDLIRRLGWDALSTRALADELGSSARPIYSFFKSMDELEEELVKRAVDLLYRHMLVPRTDDLWIDHGIGYCLFAREEKHLFLGVNNERNIRHFKKYGDTIWAVLTESLSGYPRFKGLSADQIYVIQATRWLFAHGLAFQVSNPPPDVWDEGRIIQVMKQGSVAIYEGLMKQFEVAEEGGSDDSARPA